ncbi:nitrilase-related carbon-nitrogen hydrolase [Hymenobacter metallilatus]|uniref:CN hydrolase domain-containing protein n=1 Tax=Hymenobacter metallilatus TaxID=2493666 RepID=A0A428JGW6_9BACT|nr:nitrilase-related carbon-nitrogen hydrolase [Hymenobacter metallilatus]RSK31776.1 hypothetical protein EI290_13195 [Hymenobacter metallilatus]
MPFTTITSRRALVFNLVAALFTGWLLRFVVGLEPVWWLVWLVPAFLLWLALRLDGHQARWLVILASAIGATANLPYYRLVMPDVAAVAVLGAQTLLWSFTVMASRRVILRYRSWWTVVVYPVLWVALDTLMATLLPDGNWNSLAYSQATVLPLLQVTALGGVAGLLFLVTLVPAALALGCTYGRRLPCGYLAYAAPVLFTLMAYGYGSWRLRQPVTGASTTFGLASIDDAIGRQATTAYTANILQHYEAHVARLAAQGAQVVVLPEKIADLSPGQVPGWQHRFSRWAARNRVWLEAGIGLDNSGEQTNLAWLFAPDGRLSAVYQKHFLAPPERDFTAGTLYSVRTIAGLHYGLAICKDMHFATLGRAYGSRRAAVLLVPAWDFDLDAALAARMTATRGVENGYMVVRSSRSGWLSVSDAHGRFIARRASSAIPGSTLLVNTPVPQQLPTLYTRTGNVLGWLCVLAGAGFLLAGRRGRGTPAR